MLCQRSRSNVGSSHYWAIGKALTDQIDIGAVKNVHVDKYVYPFFYLRMEIARTRASGGGGSKTVFTNCVPAM
jgi:hypothetical protein